MNISITDELNGLKCYMCEQYQGTQDDAKDNNDDKNIRGVIKDTVLSKKCDNDICHLELKEVVVCKSFGYTPEIVETNIESLETIIKPLLSPASRFFKSLEGTILRVWNYGGNWYLSTHRKINAFKSRWGHQDSFGTLFCRALLVGQPPTQNSPEDIFRAYVKQLNPDKVYVFLLQSFQENRKVCTGGPDPVLYSSGSFERSKDFLYSLDNPECGLPLMPEEIISSSATSSGDEVLIVLKDLVSKQHFNSYQGIFIVNPDGQTGKIINAGYDYMDKLRGNVENVLYRYVQLRPTPQYYDYLSLYPEYRLAFEKWENVMGRIFNNIYTQFLKRLRKETGLLHPDQNSILNRVFSKLLKGPKNKTAFLNTMNSLDERELNHMYKSYMYRESTHGNGNVIPKELEDKMLESLKKKQNT